MTFSEIILNLQKYWCEQGCALIQPYDFPAGAGTFHPQTFLKSLGTKPHNVCYVAPSRRPTDGRYGENPNRLGAYYQFQVLMKPSPANIQDLYLNSLKVLGIDLNKHDVRFIEDNWESPSLGAWGLGWEVWLDGMEVTQFTYFQQVGGFSCDLISAEITYGLERLAMYIQDIDNVYDINWGGGLTYADVHKQGEFEYSKFNFELANASRLKEMFDISYNEARALLDLGYSLPAYDYCLMCAHLFNTLDARGAISVAQRQDFMLKIRELSKDCASVYLKSQENLK